jgi:FkbM family methyltransferase
MISYAQNFEDVILNRVFKDVDRGFYIDVGAYDPEHESVTKHFYDKGWWGINVEPIVESWSRFVDSRPRDINVQVALGDHDGEALINVVPEKRYSSFDKKFADQARDVGQQCRQRSVQVLRFDTLLETHQVGETHFLKIDVEGAEEQVLAGWNPDNVRPIVILVESTVPLTVQPNHQAWEPMILDAGYSFEYFDGLNRFYLRKENQELARLFLPPNVFDKFVLASEIRGREEVTFAKAHPFRWLCGETYGNLHRRFAQWWETTTRIAGQRR